MKRPGKPEEGPTPQIRVKNGPQKGKQFPISGQKPITIGRDPSCQLQIIDKGVSREHAQIYRVGEMVFLRDLDSRNGSFVNEEKVQEELLREGDTIRVGVTQLVFENKRVEEQREVKYEDDAPFRTSLELKLDDLYVLDAQATGREGDLFKAVCQATQIVQSEREEKKIYERLLTLIQEYIPADYIYIFLRDEHTGAVAPRATIPKQHDSDVPISRSILKRVITESHAILTADAMQDERFKTGDSIVMNNIRAVLCVPIQGTGNMAMGAIYAVNSRLAETFEQIDLQLLTAIGTQLALALENLTGTRTRRRMFLQIVGRLTSLLEGVPPMQRGHAERVAIFAGAIAAEMGLSETQILYASVAGLLHDIGKVPLVTPLAKNLEERMKPVAPVMAAIEFLKDIPAITEMLPGIKCHHERYDGSGIPQGLSGEYIPMLGRILGAANVFDKLVFPTGNLAPDVDPDPALVKKAFQEMEAQKGKLFDPEVIRALMIAFRHGSLRSVTGAMTPSSANMLAVEDNGAGASGEAPATSPTPAHGSVKAPSSETIRAAKGE
ncbi:MAG TPA: HD domain-containing phosphohydrolase [Planctomycetota bacterium]|nr:HD domain-containing phosphohydrolase [Planctomycetota bacterium]